MRPQSWEMMLQLREPHLLHLKSITNKVKSHFQDGLKQILLDLGNSINKMILDQKEERIGKITNEASCFIGTLSFLCLQWGHVVPETLTW